MSLVCVLGTLALWSGEGTCGLSPVGLDPATSAVQSRVQPCHALPQTAWIWLKSRQGPIGGNWGWREEGFSD